MCKIFSKTSNFYALCDDIMYQFVETFIKLQINKLRYV